MNKFICYLFEFLSVKAVSKNDTLLGPAEIQQLIADIRAANLSYCGPPKLENIAEAVLAVRRENVVGRYIEAGVALGGSAILIGRIKPKNVSLDLYDVFEMIPPPNENDGEDAHRRFQEISSGMSKGLGGDTYYGYVDQLLDVVKGNLRKFGLDSERNKIQFLPGLFEDTLYPCGTVAFAHIDCDWYDSVKICIERIAPQLSPGGVIIFDDYSSYSGCKRAVDEWLESDTNLERIFHSRSLGVRRCKI